MPSSASFIHCQAGGVMCNTRGTSIVVQHTQGPSLLATACKSQAHKYFRFERHATQSPGAPWQAWRTWRPARLRVGCCRFLLRARSNKRCRSNLLLSRPCASAPPSLLSLLRPAPALRPVPAGASAAPGSHGRPWSRGRSTMSRMATASNHGGPRSAASHGCNAMNALLVKEGHNTSIERTNHGKPWFAAHVER
jgi:hypothetical protein